MKLDAYTWRARISPVLIVLAPLLALVAASVLGRSALAVGGGAGALALVVLVAELARDAGKRSEPGMWESWGGAPTTRRLRHGQVQDREEHARLHRRMTETTGVPLPSADEEAEDPEGADRRYAEATAVLRERTRDRSAFNLMFAENASYGFRRNLNALKPLGIAIAAAVLLGSLAALILDRATLGGAALPLVCSVVLLCVYLFVANDGWVRAAAERYAERLLASTSALTKPQ